MSLIKTVELLSFALVWTTLQRGLREPDFVGVIRILGRLRGSCTAPKLKPVTMLLRDFVLPL